MPPGPRVQQDQRSGQFEVKNAWLRYCVDWKVPLVLRVERRTPVESETSAASTSEGVSEVVPAPSGGMTTGTRGTEVLTRSGMLAWMGRTPFLVTAAKLCLCFEGTDGETGVPLIDRIGKMN
jgi:hypothetical protein